MVPKIDVFTGIDMVTWIDMVTGIDFFDFCFILLNHHSGINLVFQTKYIIVEK